MEVSNCIRYLDCNPQLGLPRQLLPLTSASTNIIG
uniref:Uncharacterized protein n=1 Tax=Rhizophora mucronata TaxID=61149 RepID=A0A2P2QSD5_RHIMU